MPNLRLIENVSPLPFTPHVVGANESPEKEIVGRISLLSTAANGFPRCALSSLLISPSSRAPPSPPDCSISRWSMSRRVPFQFEARFSNLKGRLRRERYCPRQAPCKHWP